ncbi:tuberin [Trichuris trichiura]|uniref:Tuberin n=1 Tax=Trichuris trichiura TaxID=36087 RepID=A0A077Z3C0_TRITR|nr:tuberin [Trichuris trichiura]
MPVSSDGNGRESLRTRFLRFFHLKNSSGQQQQSSLPSLTASQRAFVHQFVMKNLASTSDPTDRLFMLKSLLPMLGDFKLESGAVEALWFCVRDLLANESMREHHAVLVDFLAALCSSQYPRLGVCRVAILAILIHPETFLCDVGKLLTLLYAATDGGRGAENFEDKVGDVLVGFVKLLPGIRCCQEKFLNLAEVAVKFQAAHLGDAKLRSLIEHVCFAAGDPKSTVHCVHLCLDVFEVILCYSFWPEGTLQRVVVLLCSLVNRKDCCQKAWTVARNLLCTDNGNAIICYVCKVVKDGIARQDEMLIRGAIFIVGMALWGSQKVETLSVSPTAILPSLRSAMEINSPYVVFEVSLSIQRLVRKYGRSLEMLTWSSIIDLLWQIYQWLEQYDERLAVTEQYVVVPAKLGPKKSSIRSCFQSTLNTIEHFINTKVYNGPMESYFSLIERCAIIRSEKSLIRLLSYRQQMLLSLTTDWPTAVSRLVEVFFFGELRANVRNSALRAFQEILRYYASLYPDVIVHPIVSSLISSILNETDGDVVLAMADLMNSVVTIDTDDNYLAEVMSVQEKFICDCLRAYGYRKLNDLEEACNAAENVRHVLVGLLDVLKAKWTTGEPLAVIKMLAILIESLAIQYDAGLTEIPFGDCRVLVIKFLLSLRAHPISNRLAYVENGTEKLLVNAHIVCEELVSRELTEYNNAAEADGSTTRCKGLTDVCQQFSVQSIWPVLVDCVRKERYRPALKRLLSNLGPFLRSRPLMLTYSEGVEQLCVELLRLVDDGVRTAATLLPSGTLDACSTSSELNELVYPIFGELLAYAEFLSANALRRMAVAIQSGIKSPKSIQALMAVTHCFVRIPRVVLPMAAKLISQLYELPYSPTMAICVLELLCQLRITPMLTQRFTAKQFKRVLTIACICLNPFRFTSFIVARAFRALLSWFSSAPPSMRPSLANSVLAKLRSMALPECGGGGRNFQSSTSDLRTLFFEILITVSSLLFHCSYVPPALDACDSLAAKLESFSRLGTVHWCIESRIVSISLLCPNSLPQSIRGHRVVNNPLGLVTPPARRQRRRQRHLSVGCLEKKMHETKVTSKDDAFISDTLYLTKEGDEPKKKLDVSNGQVDRVDESSSLQPPYLVGHFELVVRNCSEKKVWRFRSADGASIASQLFANWTETLSNGSIAAAKRQSGSGEGDDTPSTRMNLKFPSKGEWRPDGTSALIELFGDCILGHLTNPCDDRPVFPFVDSEEFARALKNLDLIPEFDTHKVGVVYVAPNQVSESEILANADGSERYKRFLNCLGNLVPLDDGEEATTGKRYLGGLDTTGRDGSHTYSWKEPFEQIVFHVATMMPNRVGDPSCAQKKLHIGNNYVCIVFNEGNYDYSIGTISGQFSSVAIVVRPVDCSTLLISLKAKDEVAKWLALKEVQVSDNLAPVICRQMAVRADLSARIWNGQKAGSARPFVSNFVERWRQIAHIREKFCATTLTWDNVFR